MIRHLGAWALLAGVVLCAGPAWAGPDRNVTADPVFSDYGNSWRAIKVAVSTTTAVVISSTPVNSGLGINRWRFREIVNTSDGGLMLMPAADSYAVFSSTYSVYLSSGSNGKGDSWVVPGDGAVYGLWSSGTTVTGGGAGGSEHYWK